jgi:hypothetical protein
MGGLMLLNYITEELSRLHVVPAFRLRGMIEFPFFVVGPEVHSQFTTFQ